MTIGLGRLTNQLEQLLGVEAVNGEKFGITPRFSVAVLEDLGVVIQSSFVKDWGLLAGNSRMLVLNKSEVDHLNIVDATNEFLRRIDEHHTRKITIFPKVFSAVSVIYTSRTSVQDSARQYLNYEIPEGVDLVLLFDEFGERERFVSANVAGFIPVSMSVEEGVPTFTLLDAHFYALTDTSRVKKLAEATLRREYTKSLQSFTIKSTERFDTALGMWDNNNVRGGKESKRSKPSKILSLINRLKEKLLC